MKYYPENDPREQLRYHVGWAYLKHVDRYFDSSLSDNAGESFLEHLEEYLDAGGYEIVKKEEKSQS